MTCGIRRMKLNYLLNESVYFIEANPIRSSLESKEASSLVTYAFEKEGNSADISLLYRPPQYAETEWLNIPVFFWKPHSFFKP